MPSRTLSLLGLPSVTRADGSAVSFRLRKELALLAYLAVEGPAAQPRDTLLGLLWPDATDESARNNLRVALANLRQNLGTDALGGDRQTVRLVLESGALDVAVFRDLLAARDAHRHQPNVPCAECAARLEQAVALYRGEFLAGFALANAVAFEEWALVQRQALHQQALDALSTLADYYEQVGGYGTLCRYARRQLELEPWHEPAQRQLMRGLVLAGDRDAALAQYAVCRRVLEADLGIEPDDETRALYEHIRAMERPAESLAPHHNLPSALTPFVGRVDELAALAALGDQAGTRLVTLLGVGGMGKTRLALEAARASLNAYADGVFFVALAPLATSSALPTAVAQAIGLPMHGDDPAVALLRFLRDKHMLLVLDNFEHLRDGVGLVVDILEAAPRVAILVTSRERLNVRGEQMFVVEGLAHTDGSHSSDTPAAAVRLFEQSARRAHPAFQLGEQNLPEVMRICRLVQGMPLGIELAAAWVELLSPREIAGEIERSASFLEANWIDAPERQRSMRSVFAWSWQLLKPAEQQLFRRLALFRGGFTRQAAEAVVGASLTSLASLAHKSLLRRVESSGTAGRYEIHELLRQFAAEQLAAQPGEQAAIEERHSTFYLAFVEEREQRLARREPQEAAAEIRIEIDNVRQAWAWAVRERRLEGIERGAGGLWQFISLTGLASEGESAFGAAAEQARAAWEQCAGDEAGGRRLQRRVSKLLALYASSLMSCSKYDQSATVAEQAVAFGEASESVEGQAIGLFVWGQALYWKGQRHAARARMEQALELIERHRATPPLTEAMYFVEWNAHVWLRGIVLTFGEYAAARSHGTWALQICQRIGSRLGEVHSLCNLADVAREMRDLPAARQNYERALSLIPLVGYRWGEAVVQFELGDVVRLQGSYGRARELIERGLAVAREIGDSLEEARALAFLGRLYAVLGAYEQARAAAEQVLHAATVLETPELRVEGLLLLTMLARATGDLEGGLGYAEQTYALACSYAGHYAQAHALVLLAHTQADTQRSAAETTYEAAIARYDALGNPSLACEPRAGLAALAFARGERAHAMAQVDAVLEASDGNPRIGLDEPFDIYLTCFRILHAVHDPRAASVLNSGQRLLREYANSIADLALRCSFLENVATHRELLEAAGAASATAQDLVA
jgi:predicted ATPase/DNA-binding SARP family transcriptional activator